MITELELAASLA